MINTDNYELYFFQYQEGMLDESARREVEAFMAQHPDLAEEMTLYAEAPVLTAEEAAFPFKESLHRKEPPVLWWRYAAAAAVVVGIGATVMLTLPRQEQAAPQPLLAEAESVARPALQPQPDKTLVDERTARPIADKPERAQEQAMEEPSESPEWEGVEVNVFDSQMLVGEPCEPLLAAVEEPQTQESVAYQHPEIVWVDYSTTWSEFLVEVVTDLYPEQTMQVVTKPGQLERISKIVKFLQSIV